MKHLLPKSEFSRHVLTLMTGTTIAQIIPFAVLPILSRYFTPEQFGVLGLYLSMTAFLSILATGRYELAVVLPKTDEEAANVATLSLVLATINSIVLWVLLSLFHAPVAGALGNGQIGEWLWIVPVSVWLSGVYQTFSLWSNRRKQFKRLAISAITLQLVAAGCRIIIGQLPGLESVNGLVVGWIVGQCVATTVLLWLIGREEQEKLGTLNRKQIVESAKKFRKFPIFNAPYSLMGTFSRDFILYGLTAFGFLHQAGLFSFARSIISAPITFLSGSLGSVYYQHASVSIGTPELEEVTGRLMKQLVFLFAPVFVFFMFWAPDVFAVLFGEEWREAGRYSAAYAPAAFCFLFTSWPERIYEVTQKQQVSFLIQLISDSILIGLVSGLLYLEVAPFVCIVVFSLGSCVYHAAYLTAIFKIANFSMALLRQISFQALLLLGTFGFAVLLSILIIPDKNLSFFAGIVGLAIYYSRIATRYISLKRML